jgi:vacuolar-type H+-ATPase subunit I/STV1
MIPQKIDPQQKELIKKALIFSLYEFYRDRKLLKRIAAIMRIFGFQNLEDLEKGIEVVLSAYVDELRYNISVKDQRLKTILEENFAVKELWDEESNAWIDILLKSSPSEDYRTEPQSRKC